MRLIDPLKLRDRLWPGVVFSLEQQEMIYSVRDSVETYVPAGNKMGKDFTTGFVCPWFFLSAMKFGMTCRILTTSVKDEHLDVLWGEIGRFMTSSRVPLIRDRENPKAPFVVNYHEIRRADEMHAKNPLSYLKGQVSKKGEGLAGHHADMTLFVGDEASGLDDVAYDMAQGWAKRMLFIGNPNDCQNFFRRGVKAGDLLNA